MCTANSPVPYQVLLADAVGISFTSSFLSVAALQQDADDTLGGAVANSFAGAPPLDLEERPYVFRVAMYVYLQKPLLNSVDVACGHCALG